MEALGGRCCVAVQLAIICCFCSRHHTHQACRTRLQRLLAGELFSSTKSPIIIAWANLHQTSDSTGEIHPHQAHSVGKTGTLIHQIGERRVSGWCHLPISIPGGILQGLLGGGLWMWEVLQRLSTNSVCRGESIFFRPVLPFTWPTNLKPSIP